MAVKTVVVSIEVTSMVERKQKGCCCVREDGLKTHLSIKVTQGSMKGIATKDGEVA
jgi:hypothetical protein